jgi:VIT1/CCC1 family predicted Fe2+/Mn2+ transporter
MTDAIQAYRNRDLEASRDFHNKQPEQAAENHATGGEYIKSVILGGLDGIITTFAIVAAVEGGNLSKHTAILMGVANLVADAISMGLGDYLSERAEIAFVKTEQEREKWETENYLEGEISEMIEIYQGRGLSPEDATTVITTLAKYPKVFVENMMVDELGLMPIMDSHDPWECHKKGLITFISFMVFGAIPLATYLLLYDTSGKYRFMVACGSTLVTLFMLGVVKSGFTNQNRYLGGLGMVLNGTLAASAAYTIGVLCDT